MENPDLAGMFNDAFDPEPPPPLIDPTVRAGRSALRRRRVLACAATACVLGAVAFGATRIDATPAAQPGPIHRPSPTPSISAEEQLTRSTRVDDSWRQDCGHAGQTPCDEYAAGAAPVGIDAEGALVRTTGDIVIIKKTVDPTPPAGAHRIEVEARAPATSLPCWYVLTRHANGTVTVRIADPARSEIDFYTWAKSINRGKQAQGSPPLSGDRLLLRGTNQPS